MGLFDKLFAKQKPMTSQKNGGANDIAAYNPPAQVPKDDATVHFKGETKCKLTKARCKDGKVYCCQPYGEDSLIGYYGKEYSEVNIWDYKHEVSIGLFNTLDWVSLTVADLYANERARCDQAGLPRPRIPEFTFPAVRCRDGLMFDLQTDDLVATYEGDGIAAAAAFVCLVYELLSDTKYHQFFYNWQ